MPLNAAAPLPLEQVVDASLGRDALRSLPPSKLRTTNSRMKKAMNMMTKTRTMRNERLGEWKSFSALAVLALGVVASTGCAVDASPKTGTAAPAVAAPPAASPEAPANPKGTGETASATIDNATGGTVELPDGTQVDVPAGAMPPGVDTITVTSAAEPAPPEYPAASPVLVFGPDGTVFLKPVTVSVPFTLAAGAKLADLTVLWSRAKDAPGFDMVPTEFTPVAGSTTAFLAVAKVTHFSRGFCGKKYTSDPHPAPDPYADK